MTPTLEQVRAEAAELALRCYRDISDAAFAITDLPAAAGALQAALAEAGRLGLEVELPDILNRLGVLCCYQERFSDAERHFKRAIAILERAGDSSLDLATVLGNLARLHHSLGDDDEARALCLRAVPLFERVVSAYPDLARVLDLLSEIQLDAGEFTAASLTLNRALSLKEAVLGSDDWEVAVTLKQVARFYLMQHRRDEAEPRLRRALNILIAIVGPLDPSLCRLYTALGQLYAEQGKAQLAQTLLTTALELAETVRAPDDPEILSILRRLSEAYRQTGRLSEAEAASDLALKLLEGGDPETRAQRRLRRTLAQCTPHALDSHAPAT